MSSDIVYQNVTSHVHRSSPILKRFYREENDVVNDISQTETNLVNNDISGTNRLLLQ